MKYSTVALASFPRSGNTWMRHLLYAAAGLKSRALVPETGPAHRAGAIPEVADDKAALVKTHRMDADQYQAAIHIVRDPLAAISSYCDYHGVFISRGPAPSDFVERQARAWLDHTQHWRSARERGLAIAYCPVRYEDLCANPELVLWKVCHFLGADTTDARIAAAAWTLTLEAMRQRGSRAFYRYGPNRQPVGNLSLADLSVIRQTCGAEMQRWRYREPAGAT